MNDLAAEGWRTVPLSWHVDLDHGGRWWSLTTDQREWLWTNPEGGAALDRIEVSPGDGFVDAGGAEECFPCVRGLPDHGDAWSRRWEGSRLASHVDTAYGRLTRQVEEQPESLRIHYRAEPDEAALRRGDDSPTAPVTHAVHLLLALSDDAGLVLPTAAGMAVLDHPAPGEVAQAVWPTFDGVDLSRLGPDDGTATCAILRGLAADGPAEVFVVDGDEMLGLRWQAGDGEASVMLWRNLGGWPEGAAYRSIGVEPMVEAQGALDWRLEVTAYERG